MRWAIGLFLIAHGLIHGSYLLTQPVRKPGAPAWPFHVDRSWLFSGMGVGSSAVRTLGRLLAQLTVVGFVIAGGGLLLGQDWWRAAALVGACCSLLLLGLYYHSWLVLGIAISATLIIALIWLDWPSPQLVGF
jgi:hypothetical protein